MKRITKIFLVVIFLLALVLRFWKLDVYPEALDEDEMAMGYYAYSLIHGGTDEYGHKFPIYFESAGDYKYGLYSYIDTIPVAIFGLNAVTTRSVSAIAGSLSVIAVFFLAYEIFKKEEYAIISAFVLAVNPTFLHFSRVGYSNVLGALFAIISIAMYLKWIKGGGFKFLVSSFLTFILAIFTYQTYRIFLPVVFVLILLFLFKTLGKSRIKATLFSVVVSIAVVISFIPAVSRSRSQGIANLVNQPMITEQISEDGLARIPPVVTRIFDNKVINFSLGFIGRYISYFNPNFLFVATTNGTERHTTPNTGLLYLIEAPLLLIGLLYLFKLTPDDKKTIPLLLFFASPIAAASVLDSVSTTRAIVMVVAYVLIVSMGIYALSKLNSKYSKVILVFIFITYLGNFLYFFHEYTVHKIFHHPWYSDVGLKEMVTEVNKLQNNYLNIVMTDGHYMPYLFYNKIEPLDFVANSEFNNLAWANGVRVKRFGKLIFNMPNCPTAGKRNTLYICFDYRVPKFANLVDVIRFRDGQPAIILIEFNGSASIESLPEKLEYNLDVDKRFPGGIIPDNYGYYWPT